MSVMEDAPPVAPSRRRPSAWAWLVAFSAALVGGLVLAVGVWWATSHETRITSYAVQGSLAGVQLDMGAADVELVGGGQGALEVRRTDRFTFDHPSVERRSVANGVLRIGSACPKTVPSNCRVAYRVAVPDNVPVTVRTSTGAVRVGELRASAGIQTDSGDVTVDAFCGFQLSARSRAGDVSANTGCSPERMELRSGDGNVRAVVPRGRYRVDAVSDAGRQRVRGLTVTDDAPFLIQALSTRGSVEVQGGP
jgi:putative adhesin